MMIIREQSQRICLRAKIIAIDRHAASPPALDAIHWREKFQQSVNS